MPFAPNEKQDLRHRLVFIGSPFLVMAAWEIGVRAGLIDRRFFPAPSQVFTTIIEMFADGTMGLDILSSMRRIVVGFLIGFVPGVLVGMAMGLWSFGRAFFAPLVALTYPIPKIAILPLLLIIFGIGELSNTMVVAIGVFFLGVINTFDGVRRIPRIHFEVAAVYGIGRWSGFWHIVLPASFPGIFTGLKLSAGYALVLIVAAEMVAARSGLGHRIWLSWETYMIRELYACLAMISLLGFLMAVVLDRLETKLLPWKDR